MMDLEKIKYNKLAHFRFKELDKKMLLTNDAGSFVRLSKEEFVNFLEDKLDTKSAAYKDLQEKGFVKSKEKETEIATKYAYKNHFLMNGPVLHIFIVTLRCDNKCLYCHASARDMNEGEYDMSIETAKKSLDIVLASPNKTVAIEFQGGEPLANWEVLRFVVEEAKKRNKKLPKSKRKNLEIRLVTNFNLMTDERLEFLLENKVDICTSLDGPKELHNKNRPMIHGGDDNYSNVVGWIKKIQKYGTKVAAIPTISKYSLSKSKEIVDEYVKNKLDGVFLMPINHYGFTVKTWEQTGYSADEYIEFYKATLDYILELNKKGIKTKDHMTQIFLQKIFAERDPNMTELRSPCGAGIEQLAYNYNGKIYTCDEGRMMSEMGEESFCLGSVDNKYSELIDSPVTKTMCLSSCTIGVPGCNDCAYQPYCGICPIYNLTEQGNILGQMPTNQR